MPKSMLSFAPLILIVVVMYFLLIRPQKKREKAVNTMRSNLRVGDEIITIGGICGKVVKTKEESIVIQVGADKLKFEMMRWSISKIINGDNRPAAKEEAEDAREEAPKKTLPKRMKKAPIATEKPAEEAAEETSKEESDQAKENN